MIPWSEITVALVLVYFGFYAFIVFLSLSIATGLYYLAELIEEYTITTKRLLNHAIRAQLLVHLLLLLDRLPLLAIGAGIAAHLAYLRCMRRFPYINLMAPEGLAGLGLFATSNACWLHHYWESHFTPEYIVAFMLATTWLVPFFLFLSLAGDQAVLPGAYGTIGYTFSQGGSLERLSSSNGLAASSTNSRAASNGSKRRRGLMLGVMDLGKRWLQKRSTAAMPDAMLKEKI